VIQPEDDRDELAKLSKDELLARWIGVIAARTPVIGRRVGRISRGCSCRAYRSSCGGSAIRISRAAIDGGAVIGRGASVVAPRDSPTAIKHRR
jgi:hypothetical protein